MSIDRSPPNRTSTERWLLTAGRRGANLLSATLTPHNRVHVELRAEIREDWKDLQHGRPSPRAGKDNHAYASIGHEEDERVLRFARTVASWLAREVETHRIERVHAFSAPRFLGQLRHSLSPQTQSCLVEHPLNLEQLSPGELAIHDSVVSALFPGELSDKQSP